MSGTVFLFVCLLVLLHVKMQDILDAEQRLILIHCAPQ